MKDSNLLFYDLNLKTYYILGEKDRLFISGYAGKDVLGFQGIFKLDWGNSTSTLRWNNLFSRKLFLNTSFIFSDYKYNMNVYAEDEDDDTVTISSRIRNLSAKRISNTS